MDPSGPGKSGGMLQLSDGSLLEPEPPPPRGLSLHSKTFMTFVRTKSLPVVPYHIFQGQELWPRSSRDLGPLAGHCLHRLPWVAVVVPPGEWEGNVSWSTDQQWNMASQQPRARHSPCLRRAGSGPGCPSLVCLCHMPAACL